MKGNADNNQVILQGHRGCTGYYPENSIQGFLYAIEIGVSALELDVVVSGDDQLIVSHDPFFRGEICSDPSGEIIPKLEEKNHRIFDMTVAQIKSYSCKNDPQINGQVILDYSKPTLLEMIDSVKEFCFKTKRNIPRLTIEIKSSEQWDDDFQPSIEKYLNIIHEFDQMYLSQFEVLYHSFDVRIIKGLSLLGYKKIDLLIEKPIQNVPEFVAALDFKLAGFGLYYPLINDQWLMLQQEQQYTISVWTVNKKEDIVACLKKGVRNIITDYPLLAKKQIEKMGFSIQ